MNQPSVAGTKVGRLSKTARCFAAVAAASVTFMLVAGVSNMFVPESGQFAEILGKHQGKPEQTTASNGPQPQAVSAANSGAGRSERQNERKRSVRVAVR
jgi:hypothetical protein